MKSKFYSRYYSAERAGHGRAFGVISLGYNRCEAHMDYASFERKHPTDRRFSPREGRTLNTVVLEHVVAGGGVFRSAPTGRINVRPNSVFFTFPGVNTQWRFDEKRGLREEWVELDPAAVLPLLAEAGITPESPYRAFHALPRVSAAFRDLFDVSVDEADPGARLRIEAAAHRVLAEVLAAWRGADAPTGDALAVERMKEALLSDLADACSVERVLADAGMSATRMRTIFKAATGLSPKQFQMRARFDRAKALLRETALPVEDVAMRTGFESPVGFSHRFRQAFGLSPAEWRQRGRRCGKRQVV